MGFTAMPMVHIPGVLVDKPTICLVELELLAIAEPM